MIRESMGVHSVTHVVVVAIVFSRVTSPVGGRAVSSLAVGWFDGLLVNSLPLVGRPGVGPLNDWLSHVRLQQQKNQKSNQIFSTLLSQF